MYEKTIDNFLFSDDKSRIQPVMVHHFLSVESYWSQNIPFQTVLDCIEGSECFGIYKDHIQVGFARMVTDNATFGYLMDVFVEKEYRRIGLGKNLVRFILADPAFSGLRRIMLSTKDAHGLYTQYGFKPITHVEQYMELKLFDSYTD